MFARLVRSCGVPTTVTDSLKVASKTITSPAMKDRFAPSPKFLTIARVMCGPTTSDPLPFTT